MDINRRTFLAMAAARPDARRGEHHVYDFRGTPFEVGLQHGRALSAEIRGEAQPAIESMARRAGAVPETALALFRGRYEGLFREHVPAVLDEIHGIGEGAGLSYDYAFFAATRDMTRTGACTSLCASGRQTRGGDVLIGQTKDTSAPLDRFQIMRISYSSGRRMVILNYPGWIGNLALTSDGVAFAGNSLFASRPDGPTVPGSLLKRLIMEKRSTTEVLDAIRGMRFENGCLLIADSSRKAVCLELAAGHMEIRDISGQAFGHANEILAPALKRYETTAGHSASSPKRQRRISQLLARQADAFTVGSLQEILRDHTDFPLSICRHPAAEDPETTNAAFVANITLGEMHIAIGNPCVAPFERYALPS